MAGQGKWGIRSTPVVNNSNVIVTSGLILNLDAGNVNSYVSGSATWNDISSYGNNGTLVNGPTFNSGNGGSIVFDGTNDYVSCGNPTNLQITKGSVNTWFKANPVQNTTYAGLIVKQNFLGVFIEATKLQIYDWGNSATRDTGVVVADNIWRNICVTFTETVGTPSNNVKVYINGSLVLTTTIKYVSNSAPFLIGYGNIPYQYLKGSVSQTSVYSTILSSAEVLQNYNATKSRYI